MNRFCVLIHCLSYLELLLNVYLYVLIDFALHRHLSMVGISTFQFTLCCYGFPPSSNLTDYVFNTMIVAFYYILRSNKGIFV